MSLPAEHLMWHYLNTDGQIINALIEGPLRAGDIYPRVSASQPVVSKKCKILESDGMIERRWDDHDRRVVWYALTEACIEKLLGGRDNMSLK